MLTLGPRDVASGPAQTAVAERIGGGGKEGSDVATVGCGFRFGNGRAGTPGGHIID